jgi:hypothetical protein
MGHHAPETDELKRNDVSTATEWRRTRVALRQ